MTMQKIRIGKEFSVRWTLTVNGERTDLHSLPVTVILVYPSGRRKQMDFIAEGDELLIPVNRDVQKETGVYRLEAWVNKDKDGQTVTDCCNAFSLVERSCQESDEQTGSDVKLEQEIVLSTSNIQMGVTGKSAYQVWLDNGNEGTEQDFLNWMKQPAEHPPHKLSLLPGRQKPRQQMQTRKHSRPKARLFPRHRRRQKPDRQHRPHHLQRKKGTSL